MSRLKRAKNNFLRKTCLITFSSDIWFDSVRWIANFLSDVQFYQAGLQRHLKIIGDVATQKCKALKGEKKSPGLSEFASIKGGINHIKSLDTDPKWKCIKSCSAAGHINEVIFTYDPPLPVYQDPLQAFTLHILQVDLDLAEHEVVWLGIPVADCQQLLQAGRVQLLWILDYMWPNCPGPKLYTLKIPKRFSAILARKPGKLTLGLACIKCRLCIAE